MARAAASSSANAAARGAIERFTSTPTACDGHSYLLSPTPELDQHSKSPPLGRPLGRPLDQKQGNVWVENRGMARGGRRQRGEVGGGQVHPLAETSEGCMAAPALAWLPLRLTRPRAAALVGQVAVGGGSRPLGRHEHHERRAQLLDLPILARVRCTAAGVPRRAARRFASDPTASPAARALCARLRHFDCARPFRPQASATRPSRLGASRW
jgi:hypothetical protein